MQETLTAADDALESIHPGASHSGNYSLPAPDASLAGDLTSTEPIPGSPQWLAQAIRTYAPQMDRMGLSREQRPPFLRDLFALVTTALDMVDQAKQPPFDT